MYFSKDIDVAAKQATAMSEAYREAASLIPDVIRVMKQFDGKCYNCRFGKAIEEAIGSKAHVYVERKCGNISIEVNARHNGQYHWVTLASLSEKDLTGGKRIPADKFIESAREKQGELLKQAYDIEQYIAQLPQIRDYLSDVIGRLNGYLGHIPYYVRNLMGLPYKVALY